MAAMPPGRRIAEGGPRPVVQKTIIPESEIPIFPRFEVGLSGAFSPEWKKNDLKTPRNRSFPSLNIINCNNFNYLYSFWTKKYFY
jgi:hypothetical protein